LSTLLNNQLPIDLTNIPELQGDVYRHIVKQADTQRGWRELMEPVRTADNPATLWVLKEVANDPNNHYVNAH
jgi:hypothetical protein